MTLLHLPEGSLGLGHFVVDLLILPVNTPDSVTLNVQHLVVLPCYVNDLVQFIIEFGFFLLVLVVQVDQVHQFSSHLGLFISFLALCLLIPTDF